MRVELNVPESVTEPRMWVKHQPVLAMALRPGSFELGLRRSEMIRLSYDSFRAYRKDDDGVLMDDEGPN